MNKLKIYLSGPISGVDNYKENFALAEATLHERWPDAVIINPAVLPEGLSNKDYIMTDLQLLSTANILALIPGWETSTGAKLEKLFAQYIGGIGIMYLGK